MLINFCNSKLQVVFMMVIASCHYSTQSAKIQLCIAFFWRRYSHYYTKKMMILAKRKKKKHTSPLAGTSSSSRVNKIK